MGQILRKKMPIPVKEGSLHENIDYACHSCSNYMAKGKMAPMSNQNSLQLINTDDYPEFDLKEVENQLVAPNLIFQKIKLLPKSRWNAMLECKKSKVGQTNWLIQNLPNETENEAK